MSLGNNDNLENDQPNPEPELGTLAPGTYMAAAGATEPDLIIEDLPEYGLSEYDLPKQKQPYLRKYSCTKKDI